MAIFASTTTSGYSDPLKALSIKALEQRQKDMQAQIAAAQQGGITPDNTQTPIQGFGHLANIIGDSVRQNRADAAVAAQKQALAGLIAKHTAGADWSPQELGPIGVADPDLRNKLMEQAYEARQKKEQYAHDDTYQQAGFTHADTAQKGLFTHQDTTAAAEVQARKDAAAELARTQAQAKVDEENRLLARPTDAPVAQMKRALERGEVSKDEFDAWMKKNTGPSAAEQEHVIKHQDESVSAQSTLGTLDEALALLNSPKGIHTGNFAGKTQTIGENVPTFMQGSRLLPDEETTNNTRRFNKIMGAEALSLLTQMKGASSDKDVQINFNIANDPNETKDNKIKAIQVLKTKLAAHLAVQNAAIKGAGGDVPKLGGAEAATATTPAPAAAATPAADPLAEAQAAIDKGAPLDAVSAIFAKKGGDPSKLKPKAP
jgi:hypothetical protein